MNLGYLNYVSCFCTLFTVRKNANKHQLPRDTTCHASVLHAGHTHTHFFLKNGQRICSCPSYSIFKPLFINGSHHLHHVRRYLQSRAKCSLGFHKDFDWIITHHRLGYCPALRPSKWQPLERDQLLNPVL